MKKRFLSWSVGLFSLTVLLSSCLSGGDAPEPVDVDLLMRNGLAAVDQTQLAKDKKIIDDSLALWQTQNVQIDSIGGVRYVITTLGTGTVATTSQAAIAVNYKMRLLKDYLPEATPHKPVKDQSTNFQINLFRLILGWQTAFRELPAGTSVKLYVPSGLGYGTATNIEAIPPNSNLIFEIDIIQVVNP